MLSVGTAPPRAGKRTSAAPPGECLVRRTRRFRPGDRAQHCGGGGRASGRADRGHRLRLPQPRPPRQRPGWLSRFSEEQIATSPPLCLAAAKMGLADGDGALGEHWARIGAAAAEHAGHSTGGGALADGFALVQAWLARDGIARMERDAARASESLPQESPWLAECCLIRGIAAHLGGDRGTGACRARRRGPPGRSRRTAGPSLLLGATGAAGDRGGRLERRRAAGGSRPIPSRAIRPCSLPKHRARARNMCVRTGPTGPCRRCARGFAAIRPPARCSHELPTLVRGRDPSRTRARNHAP